MFCMRALCFCVFAFCGPSHDEFLWQPDFENSSSLTAHCCRKFCRRQPTLDAWLIHRSLSSHSHFCTGSPAWISDGDGCVGGGVVAEAGVSMLWLAGGIHLICCGYYGVRPCTPPPLPAPTASIHNSVLSLFQGEYQLCTGRRGLVQPLSSSAYTFPENHMRAAPLLYKTWHSYHRDSTWSTVTAVRGFNKDQFCFFPFWTLFNDFQTLFFNHLKLQFVFCDVSILRWQCK